MRGGSAFYCPACTHRQVVGTPGQKLTFPMNVACENCRASIRLEKSASGGIHPEVVQGQPAT